MKQLKYAIAIVMILIQMEGFAQENTHFIIPLAGNAFSSAGMKDSKTITNRGIENWADTRETFTCYFRVSKPGEIILAVDGITQLTGKSVLEFTVNKQSKTLVLEEGKKTAGVIGKWKITDTGYVTVLIKGIQKTAAYFPSFSNLKIEGSAATDGVRFVKDNAGNFYYWGRRGPSVHLSYQQPENVNASWFYNEVTVPKGGDVIGSYYMANGFAEGYFGIQVNSATERRILFSVWSPFNTDDPQSIPESHKIKMLKKGEHVYSGEFGNEGSGGQSYLKYNWVAGNTYKFLLRGVPSDDSTTTYTAWFYPPELGKWQLIASFKRPKTKTYLKRFHSFLENFIPEQGNITRKVLFNNQWIADADGKWTELNSARFTTDNTGNKQYRMDFQGGVSGNQFYLKNCGFFEDYTVPKTIFSRPFTHRKPVVDLNALP